MLQVLTQVGLIEDLVAAGKQVAETMIEMFADLPPDHEFFEQFSFISANDLPEFVAILGRIGEGGTAALAKQIGRSFSRCPSSWSRHDTGSTFSTTSMQRRLLEARKVFRANLPQKARQQIEFFDPERYNAAASVQDNILFGKIAYGEADAPARIPQGARRSDRRVVAPPDHHRCRSRLQRRHRRIALIAWRNARRPQSPAPCSNVPTS